jgi:hypothetical protein
MDRRRHKRHAVIGSPLAVMRPGPSRPGKLLRISKVAAEIIYCQVNGAGEATTDELDVLVPDFARGIFLERIPVKTVSDFPAPPLAAREHDYEQVRKRVVSFEKLTPDQQGQLQSFIWSHGG